ncbi:MAG: hypothetical protein MZV63_48195 [Marinilabiliales bacterium]|nr:hypothetical protein [Marinilabiliales bacterium]
MTSGYLFRLPDRNDRASRKVECKFRNKCAIFNGFDQLPDKSHCLQGKIEEDHFCVAVAFYVGIGKIELTVEGIDVLLVDEGMELLERSRLQSG